MFKQSSTSTSSKKDKFTSSWQLKRNETSSEYVRRFLYDEYLTFGSNLQTQYATFGDINNNTLGGFDYLVPITLDNFEDVMLKCQGYYNEVFFPTFIKPKLQEDSSYFIDLAYELFDYLLYPSNYPHNYTTYRTKTDQSSSLLIYKLMWGVFRDICPPSTKSWELVQQRYNIIDCFQHQVIHHRSYEDSDEYKFLQHALINDMNYPFHDLCQEYFYQHINNTLQLILSPDNIPITRYNDSKYYEKFIPSTNNNNNNKNNDDVDLNNNNKGNNDFVTNNNDIIDTHLIASTFPTTTYDLLKLIYQHRSTPIIFLSPDIGKQLNTSMKMISVILRYQTKPCDLFPIVSTPEHLIIFYYILKVLINSISPNISRKEDYWEIRILSETVVCTLIELIDAIKELLITCNVNGSHTHILGDHDDDMNNPQQDQIDNKYIIHNTISTLPVTFGLYETFCCDDEYNNNNRDDNDNEDDNNNVTLYVSQQKKQQMIILWNKAVLLLLTPSLTTIDYAEYADEEGYARVVDALGGIIGGSITNDNNYNIGITLDCSFNKKQQLLASRSIILFSSTKLAVLKWMSYLPKFRYEVRMPEFKRYPPPAYDPAVSRPFMPIHNENIDDVANINDNNMMSNDSDVEELTDVENNPLGEEEAEEDKDEDEEEDDDDYDDDDGYENFSDNNDDDADADDDDEQYSDKEKYIVKQSPSCFDVARKKLWRGCDSMEYIWYSVDAFLFAPHPNCMHDIVHKLLHQAYTNDNVNNRYQYYYTNVVSNNNNDKVYQQFKQCYKSFLDYEQINDTEDINDTNNNNNNIIYNPSYEEESLIILLNLCRFRADPTSKSGDFGGPTRINWYNVLYYFAVQHPHANVRRAAYQLAKVTYLSLKLTKKTSSYNFQHIVFSDDDKNDQDKDGEDENQNGDEDGEDEEEDGEDEDDENPHNDNNGDDQDNDNNDDNQNDVDEEGQDHDMDDKDDTNGNDTVVVDDDEAQDNSSPPPSIQSLIKLLYGTYIADTKMIDTLTQLETTLSSCPPDDVISSFDCRLIIQTAGIPKLIELFNHSEIKVCLHALYCIHQILDKRFNSLFTQRIIECGVVQPLMKVLNRPDVDHEILTPVISVITQIIQYSTEIRDVFITTTNLVFKITEISTQCVPLSVLHNISWLLADICYSSDEGGSPPRWAILETFLAIIPRLLKYVYKSELEHGKDVDYYDKHEHILFNIFRVLVCLTSEDIFDTNQDNNKDKDPNLNQQQEEEQEGKSKFDLNQNDRIGIVLKHLDYYNSIPIVIYFTSHSDDENIRLLASVFVSSLFSGRQEHIEKMLGHKEAIPLLIQLLHDPIADFILDSLASCAQITASTEAHAMRLVDAGIYKIVLDDLLLVRKYRKFRLEILDVIKPAVLDQGHPRIIHHLAEIGWIQGLIQVLIVNGENGNRPEVQLYILKLIQGFLEYGEKHKVIRNSNTDDDGNRIIEEINMYTLLFKKADGIDILKRDFTYFITDVDVRDKARELLSFLGAKD